MPKLKNGEARAWKKNRILTLENDKTFRKREIYSIYGEVKTCNTPEFALPLGWVVNLQFGDKIYDETSKIRLATLKLIYKDTFLPKVLNYRPKTHASMIGNDFFVEEPHNEHENYTEAIVYQGADGITINEFYKLYNSQKGRDVSPNEILNMPVYSKYVEKERFDNLIIFMEENADKIPKDEESQATFNIITKKIDKMKQVLTTRNKDD